MQTAWVHRILLIVPAAKAAAVNAWITANIDPPPAGNWLTIGLNASGLASDPVTYYWCWPALTDPQCKALLFKICSLASVTPPTAGQWAGWTQAQKIAWLQSVQAALFSGYGIWVSLCDNTSSWDDAFVILVSRGLKIIQPTRP